MNKQNSTRRLAYIALLGSLGSMLMLWQIPYPGAPFLQFDISQVPVLIAGFAMGPWSGFSVLLLKNVIFLILKFSPPELVGIPMNVFAQGTFVLAAAYIYHRRKTWSNAMTGLFSGIIASTLIMIPANYFILPLFMQWFTPEAVIPKAEQLMELIIISVIPYNLINGLINAVITYFIYKRVSRYLHDRNEADPKLPLSGGSANQSS